MFSGSPAWKESTEIRGSELYVSTSFTSKSETTAYITLTLLSKMKLYSKQLTGNGHIQYAV
jgi:hypothetical protein